MSTNNYHTVGMGDDTYNLLIKQQEMLLVKFGVETTLTGLVKMNALEAIKRLESK